jgi:hypothetical protein
MKKPVAAKKAKKTEATGPKAFGPFDFLNSINEGANGPNLLAQCRTDISEGGADPASPDKAYVPFMVNRGLSFYPDTVLLANIMNMHASLPVKMQYDFLRGTISKRKRWSKWLKRVDDGPDIELIKKAYTYSTDKARQVLGLFTPHDLVCLREKFSTGGFVK